MRIGFREGDGVARGRAGPAPPRWRIALITTAMIGSAAALPGCSTATSTHLASGRSAYLINCDLGASGFTGCFRLAGDLCGPYGFALYDWEGRRLSGRRFDVSGPDVPTLETKNILVSCNPRPVPAS